MIRLRKLYRPARLCLLSAAALFLLFLLGNVLFPLQVNVGYSSVISDREGKMLHAYLTPDDKWRMFTELHEITPELKKALIFKEDKYFYYHFGINPMAIGRALFNNIVKGKRTSGASTITMQVARMLEPKRRTYWNKLEEMFRALQLEWDYSKDEILQLYLNLVPYGSNIEGVKAASVLYFEKMPNHLSLAQLTTLTIIPNRPSSLRLGKRNELIVEERNKWLQRFKASSLFREQDILDALEEPLEVTRHEGPKHAPHFSYRMKRSHPGMPIVKTTLDMGLQSKTELLVANYVNRIRSRGIQNAAVMIMDNRSRQVLAYVGSADFNNAADGGQVDGIRAIRSPGSTLKPVLYATAVDLGFITPMSTINDVPINISGYAPENYEQKFYGKISVTDALATSLNIPAVKLLDKVETPTLVNVLKACNFNQIAKDDEKLGLSLVLGGCGVSLEELTGLYSTLANGGAYHEPVWLRTDTIDSTQQVISAASAYMITEILTTLTRPDLPDNWRSSIHLPKVAWKTGTSYGRRDAWSIGYNRKYTIGVWVGNFSAEGVPELNGADIATPLLFNLFNSIGYNSPNEWYAAPEEVDFRNICSETGLVPSSFCTSHVLGAYIPGVSSSRKCNHMKLVSISADSTMAYCTSCRPAAGYIERYYPNHDAEILAYFDEYQINYEKIPSHNPECERVFAAGEPKITSPVARTEYLIDKADTQQIMLTAIAANDVDKVYWYINDRFFGPSAPNKKLFFTPVNGRTKISCTDDKGRNTNIYIDVKYVTF